MRIAVLNLQSGIGITKGYQEYFTSGWKYVLPHSSLYVASAGEMLREEAVDIALATEVDGFAMRSGFTSQTDLLRESAGLAHAEYFPTRMVSKLVQEGNAILANHPIERRETHPLTASSLPRIMGEVTLLVGDRKVHVFVAHLGLRDVYRSKQIEDIRTLIEKRDEPVILGGDFNERDHEAFEILKAAHFSHLAALHTFPSWKPQHALDVLFLSPHFSRPRVYIPASAPFSDHLPLIVETELL